ncbi:MAG: ABC transporter substrate-binding protein [Haloarculaceae archaeon]
MTDSNQTDREMERRRYVKALAGFGAAGAAGLAGCSGGDGGSDGGSNGGSDGSSDGSDGSSDGSDGSDTGGGSSPVEITYRDRIDILSGYADAFNKTHDDVKINANMEPREEKYRGVIAQISAGNAPEALGMDVIYLPRFVQLGALSDLGSFFDGLDYTDDFFQPLQEDFIRWDGTVYGLPFWIDCSVFLYNKSHYEEAGLDPENPPTTFSEFMDACAALDQAGYTPLSNTLAFTGLEVFFFMPHVWAGGGKLFNDEMTKSLVDQQPAVDALEFFVELQEKGYSTDQTSSESFTYPAFNSEEASMAYTGSGIGNVKKNNKKLYNNMGVSMFPKPEGGTQSSFLGGNTLVIPKQVQQNQEKFEAAKTFANWVNTEEGMSTTVEQMGYLPARKAGFELDYVQERWDIYGTFKKALTQGHAPPMHPDILQMQSPLNNAIQRALLGEQEPKTALSQAADEITKILQG